MPFAARSKVTRTLMPTSIRASSPAMMVVIGSGKLVMVSPFEECLILCPRPCDKNGHEKTALFAGGRVHRPALPRQPGGGGDRRREAEGGRHAAHRRLDQPVGDHFPPAEQGGRLPPAHLHAA